MVLDLKTQIRFQSWFIWRATNTESANAGPWSNSYHNVGCEFRDPGSIPSVCQITDADLGQVG